MNVSQTFLRIKKEPYFLLETYVKEILVFAGLISILRFLPFMSISVSGSFLSSILGMVLGVFMVSLLHHASHSNLGKLNRAVGESCGAWVLSGFTNFLMVHTLHHQHTNDEFDPIYPGQMTFLEYLFASLGTITRITKKWLRSQHGHRQGHKHIVKLEIVLFTITVVLRLMFWFLLLGPVLFISFYLPAVLTTHALRAHMNYVCNRNREDGSVEVVNLNHNFYFKVVNYLTSGGYFHLNHHREEAIFNPQKLKGAIYLPEPKRFYRGSKLAKYFSIHDVWGEGKRNRVRATIQIKLPRREKKNLVPTMTTGEYPRCKDL